MQNNTDSRLIQAYKLIQSNKIELLSIDIFDTLLWRKIPLPTDLFLILGRRLKIEGWLIEAVSAEGFPFLRMAAEQLARQKKLANSNGQTSEVNLDDIYWELSGVFSKITIEQMIAGQKGIINETDISELVSLEVSLEQEMIELDANIADLIQCAVNKNIKVVLVSDIYFQLSHIHRFLEKCLLDVSLIHNIFLSCEVGVGKRTGLFQTVLKEMQVSPQKMLHIGDNYLSDCVPAEKEKIKTIFYQKYDDELTKVLKAEWPTDERQRSLHLDDKQGDFGLSAMRSRICHNTALNKIDKKKRALWRYGATVFAPFIVGFISWIYKRCQEMKQKQVLCLMREGRLYANIIKQLASWYPDTPIDAKELWVSRRFLSEACIINCAKDELLALLNIHPLSPYTLSTYCKLLGIDIKKMGSLKKEANVELKELSIVDKVIGYIMENEELRRQIISNSAVKRQRFLKYFSKVVDLTTCREITLMDLGWAGSIQGMLQRILYYSGYKITIHGLYLGTTEKASYSLLQGYIREGFLLKAGYPIGAIKAIRRGIYVLEQTATSICNTGSLKEIDDAGNVVTGVLSISKEQISDAKIIVNGIETYIHELNRYIKRKAIHSLEKSEAFQNQLRQILLRATSLPTKNEVQAFTSWSHDFLSGHSTEATLGDNRYYEKFIGNILPGLDLEDWNIMWPAAYAARFDENLALSTQKVRMQELPAKCFLSHDVFPLKAYLNRGIGFGKRAVQVVKMRSNANRKFYGHFKLISLTKPIQQLRFTLDAPNALIRINSIRLIVKTRDSDAAQMLTFFESDDASRMGCDGNIKQLSFNTFECKNKPLSFTHTFKDIKEIYQITVNICCEKFSQR